jgi:DNA-directed RNA polymerase specialized sigma24 family protein
MSMTEAARKQVAEFVGMAYRRYSGSLLRMLSRRLPTRQDADDACHNVFRRLLSVEDAASIRDPQGYVYTLAFHELSEFYSDQRAGAELCMVSMDAIDEAETVLLQEGLERKADVEMLIEQVTKELWAMPAVHRSAVLCCKFLGMTYGEAAREMGTSVHKLERYLAAGMKHLNASELDY